MFRKLVRRVAANFEYKIKEKKIQLKLIGEEVIIEADQDRIFQVVTNILANAIKYTSEEDKIIIKLYKNIEYAVCEIADTGIGIPQEEVAHIFRGFIVQTSPETEKQGELELVYLL